MTYLVVGNFSNAMDFRVVMTPYNKHWNEAIYYETESLIKAVIKAHRLTNYDIRQHLITYVDNETPDVVPPNRKESLIWRIENYIRLLNRKEMPTEYVINMHTQLKFILPKILEELK